MVKKIRFNKDILSRINMFSENCAKFGKKIGKKVTKLVKKNLLKIGKIYLEPKLAKWGLAIFSVKN